VVPTKITIVGRFAQKVAFLRVRVSGRLKTASDSSLGLARSPRPSPWERTAEEIGGSALPFSRPLHGLQILQLSIPAVKRVCQKPARKQGRRSRRRLSASTQPFAASFLESRVFACVALPCGRASDTPSELLGYYHSSVLRI